MYSIKQNIGEDAYSISIKKLQDLIIEQEINEKSAGVAKSLETSLKL